MFIYLSIMNCFQQLNLKFPPSLAVIALIMAVCACLCIYVSRLVTVYHSYQIYLHSKKRSGLYKHDKFI